MVYAGLDVHKRCTQICLEDENGALLERRILTERHRLGTGRTSAVRLIMGRSVYSRTPVFGAFAPPAGMTSRRNRPLPMTMGRFRLFTTAIVAAICLNAGVANAASPDEADALVEQGVKLRVQGKNSEALERFKKAHAL